jgi:hypothetical protein
MAAHRNSCRRYATRGLRPSGASANSTICIIHLPGVTCQCGPGTFFAARRVNSIDKNEATHAAASLARSSIFSSARTGTRNRRPILIVGMSPLLAAT